MYIFIYVYCSTKWIKTHGEEYHCGNFIVTGRQENDLPIFSKVVSLMMIVDSPVVEVNTFRTVGLSNHLMSYQIETTLHCFCMSLSIAYNQCIHSTYI